VKIIWSPLALERVVEIAEFIARDRPNAAVEWSEAIFAAVVRLKDFPQSGGWVAESPRADLREVIHGSHRIIYRVEPERLVVLTVRHARQDLRPDDPDLS
jgi:toxin ParE1/3/4